MKGAVLCFLGLALLGAAMGQPTWNTNDEKYEPPTGRSSEGDFLNQVQSYLQGNGASFDLPIAGAKITVSPRSLEEEELNIDINFAGEEEARASGVQPRKSKLKKIVIPILIFILLKVMTVVPLLFGVLGLKAWNALQLTFFSFVISFGLAVFQLCKKFATDNSVPHIHAHAHSPWDALASNFRARSMDETISAQNLAYSSYL